MFYKHLDAIDCGQSYLAMIVKQYRLHPDIKDIRNKYGLNKDGTTLLEIAQSLKSQELSYWLKISFDDLDHIKAT